MTVRESQRNSLGGCQLSSNQRVENWGGIRKCDDQDSGE